MALKTTKPCKWKKIRTESKQNCRQRCLARQCSLNPHVAASTIQVIAQGGAHHTTSPCWFSVQEYTTNLHRVGYIVAVHHPVASNAEPPMGLLALSWEERTYHLSPANDTGFIHSSPEYSIVVLNEVLAITRLPGQAGGDGEHTDG